MKSVLAILGLMLMLSCKNSNSDEVSSLPIKDSIPKSQSALDKIDVISMKSGYSKGKIKIYNSDGSIWKEFEYSDNFSDPMIMPYAQKAENSILIFRVTGSDNGMYSIVVNENSGVRKYMKPNDNFFNFQTWQQNILTAFSVGFDNKKNPLKENPSDTSKTTKFDTEQFYHPVSIEGDWLKVKDDNDNLNWIKWRDEKGSLIIEIYYDA